VHENVWGSRGKAPCRPNFAVDGGRWSASCLSCFDCRRIYWHYWSGI